MKSMKYILSLALLLLLNIAAQAQCSMCKISAENSIVEGKTSIALGLNTGILYLAAFPYLLAGIFIFMWYRRYKRRKLYEEVGLE